MALPQPTGPLRRDRARIVSDCRMAADPAMNVINESSTLYGERRFVIECPRRQRQLFLL